MILKIQKHLKNISLILAVLMIFLCLDVFAEEEENEERGKCEEAFDKCFIDAAKNLPNFTLFYVYTIYCVSGYTFCKKYLEK